MCEDYVKTTEFLLSQCSKKFQRLKVELNIRKNMFILIAQFLVRSHKKHEE